MNDHPPNDIVTNMPAIEINLTPLGLRHYADQYAKAYETCKDTHEGFSPVPYYLVCHGMELILKAYCLARGVELRRLKNVINHDLVRLLVTAEQNGLSNIVTLSEELRLELAKANAYYSKKGFEYFSVMSVVTGYKSLPDCGVIERMLRTLIDKLHKICLDAT